MPINDTYVVPNHVVNFLCDYERSFLGLRLVHGLIYAMDNVVRGKMSLVPARFHRGHSVRTSTIAAAVGPEKAKDNRWIHAACQELAGQNLLRSVEINGRALRFQLSANFLAAFSRPTKAFAIMRTDQVRQCRSLHDLMFLSLASLHGRKDRPRFFLPRIPLHLEPVDKRFTVFSEETPKQAPWRASWSQSSRTWTNAAVRIGKILEHSYLIAPRQDMVDDFVSEVAVKIQTHNTKWERGKLYKFPPGTRGVVEIPIGMRKTVLNGEAFQRKWHQRIIQ